jgi:hypothetical protein
MLQQMENDAGYFEQRQRELQRRAAGRFGL